MTAEDIDPLPDPASLDFLRGRCCSCSGGVSDCAATGGDNNKTRCPHRTPWVSSTTRPP